MTLAIDARVQLGEFRLDLTVAVQPGEVLAVLGPNGAGKSTLLRAVAGLVALDGGSITLGADPLDRPDDRVFVDAEHRSVGVVFQDYLLFPHLDALDNIAFGLCARGASRRDGRRSARGWLDRVGLADLAHARPRELSGGQAQRIALARTLAVEPRVLLLDEPLAALDAGTRIDVRRDLRRHLSTFGGATLLVTHDPVDAYALADRVAIVEGGRLVQVGTLADVTAHPKSRYVADLIGVNLVTGVITDHVLVTAEGAEIVVADTEPGASFAAIRPQAITLSRDRMSSSARNSWAGFVGDIDRMGERARVTVAGVLPLTAEITVGALEALALQPGDPVVATVKATEIRTYPT